ncbi:MAG: protein kinase [Acidobacteriota bacterium]
MGYQTGDKVGDYEIIGILGAGGMGQVYKVRNVISDRHEAMKVLLPDLEHQPELADRFLREIKVLAALDHPNIAALRTALRSGNQLVMIMELVEGISLEERMRQGPIPIPEVIDCFSQALSALSYAHSRNVIHRDIKPANIMVTPGGAVKLMDFGIAKATGDRQLTKTGTTIGSLYYMSPEQVSGAPLDPRSDLYSVGVTLYEVLTGTRPFQGDSDFSIMAAHLDGQFTPPIQVNPALPPELNEIVLLAINKDPARRFQSADAFRAALASVGKKPGVAPAPAPAVVAAAPPPPPPPAAARSHRGLYMALGAVLAVAALVVAATQLPKWYRTRATATQEVATPATPPPTESAAPPVAPPPAEPAAPAPARQSSPPPKAAPTQPAPQQPAPTEPTPAQPAPSQPAPVETAPPPAPAAADVQQAHDRMVMLSSRAGAVKTSLENLQRVQQQAGMSLRADMSASWKRMEYYMDLAESALNRSDLPAARRNMDLAEREIDKLEAFLGR